MSAGSVAGRSSSTVILRCDTGRSIGSGMRLRSSSSFALESRAISDACATSATIASSLPSGPP